MNSKVKGYLLGSLAAATYGTNPLFALPLYADGMDAESVLFFRYLLAAPMVALMLVMRGRRFAVSRAEVWPLSFTGVMAALSSLTLFLSYSYMDAGIASTLLFVYPLMVALIMSLCFGESLRLSTVLCLIMALCGIALLFKGGDGATLSVTGTMLVMASSLTYAIYIVWVNRPSLRQVPTLKIIFYTLCIGVLIYGAKIIATPGASFATPRHWYMWGCLIGLALLPTVVSFLSTTEAIHCIGSTPTAILGALEPLTAVIFGITVFGEKMTPRDWLGLALIVAAVSIVVGGGAFTSYLVRFRKLFPSLRAKKRA
ncbi:MAG: DMT family transporter [Muribaculaceae bacterium]|nr:DMT family transporter [Muribaculaceae bacterium]